MAPEGELRVGLQLGDGRIRRVRIDSTRPEVARALLQGRSRAELRAAVPLLFSICGHSQALANELACRAALGEPVDAPVLAQGAAAVGAEMLREGARRTLLEAPRALGEVPDDAAIAAARQTLNGRGGDADAAVAAASFGMPAAQWLALDTLPDIDRWADAGRSAAARFLRRVRDDEAADGPCTAVAAAPAWLCGRQHEAWVDEIARRVAADAGFARQPLLAGAPAETGALARQHDDALLQAWMARAGARTAARFLARLRELAQLLDGATTSVVGAQALPDGAGMAWVENTRGVLVHWVRFEHDRAVALRIVAPTEWNFHPAGALAGALLDSPAATAEAARRRCARLIDSLDPCVSYRVEIDDA